MRETKKKSNIFNIIRKITKVFLIVLFLCFVLVVCLQRFTNNKLSLFNYRMFAVLTDSMVPEYKIGDVLIAKEVDVSTLKVGDDISYIGRENSFKDKIVTHRIVKIDYDEDGNLIFLTQGIKAGASIDPIVYENQIYGKVIYDTLLLSLVHRITTTTLGMFALIVIPIAYLIISEIIASLLEKEAKRRI